MKDKNHSHARTPKQGKGRGITSKSVTQKVLAGTIGLSLLQVPMFASAANFESGSTTISVSGSAQAVSSSQQALNPADAKISKAEAESRVRSLFPILNEAKLNGVDYGEQNVYPQNNKKVWVLNWSISKGNSTSGFSTEVDALSGDILSYYYPRSMDNQDADVSYYPPKISEQEAKKIAEDFIPKASPSLKSGDLKPSDQIYYSGNKALFGPVQYSFAYQVQMNGIPADNELVNISIDGKGEVIV